MPSLALVMLVCAALIIPIAARGQGTTDVASVGWLTGCLELKTATRVVEEQRMPLVSGTMLGMGRTTSTTKGLASYELTLIKQDGARLLYEAHPSGQPVTTFVASVANADSVVFVAPTHDFPQRVGYRRLGRDSVLAWIDGTMRGAQRRIEFAYRRVVCAAAP
ncbi:MAG: DUF6265 family protein [Gemmatimonadaceae bacterium]